MENKNEIAEKIHNIITAHILGDNFNGENLTKILDALIMNILYAINICNENLVERLIMTEQIIEIIKDGVIKTTEAQEEAKAINSKLNKTH